jgi:hypothetical protein
MLRALAAFGVVVYGAGPEATRCTDWTPPCQAAVEGYRHQKIGECPPSVATVCEARDSCQSTAECEGRFISSAGGGSCTWVVKNPRHGVNRLLLTIVATLEYGDRLLFYRSHVEEATLLAAYSGMNGAQNTLEYTGYDDLALQFVAYSGNNESQVVITNWIFCHVEA